MRRLLFVLLVSCVALGQTFTPNLSLQLPPRGAVNWDSVINHNFTTLDINIGRLQNPFMGPWSSSVTYFKGQQVTSGGLLYISLSDFNLANTPASFPTLWSNIAITGVPTPHAFLSTTHTDTTAASAVRGDGIFALGATPTWQRVAHSVTTGGYWKWNGTDVVPSTNAAAGTGACAGGQFVSAENADAPPTCGGPTVALPTGTGYFHLTTGAMDVAAKLISLTASTDVAANQGTTTTVLHGNGAGQPGFSSVVSSDLSLTTTTCTNQFVTAISGGGVGTCTTDVLASAQHANQGTATTVLHGNGAGNPAFGAVVLTTDVSGVLPQANGGTGQNSTAVFPTSGNIVSEAATETLSSKRITQRVVTLGSSTTFTPDGDNSDLTQMNMTGTTGTLTIAAPTGTPTDAQKLILRIKTTNSQTYSFNATYRFSTTTVAPTTIGAAKTDLLGLIWNATDTKWDVVAVDQGH